MCPESCRKLFFIGGSTSASVGSVTPKTGPLNDSSPEKGKFLDNP